MRRRVVDRLDALGFGVRQVERIAEQVVAEALDAATASPRQEVVMDSIRTRVHVAMLLVDIIGSTRLLADAGETHYVGTVRRLVEAVRCHPTAADLQFLKCTGDGVLALYGSVDSAVEAGAQLDEIVTASHRVPLRRVVHYGRVRHGPVGDFLGVEMHRVFRIEALATDDRVGDGPVLPHARLLVTAAARDQLEPAHRERLRPAGSYRLTGFGEPVELWIYPREVPAP
jgi:class 3 adenylate cyclase